MLSDEYDIPRHGKAGVAFLGVELADAWIVILGVFVGLFAGFILQAGAVTCMVIWFGGFLLNKWYADWQTKTAPGQIRTYLFRIGLVGYSNVFKGGNTVFRGDDRVINPDAHLIVDEALRRPRRAAEAAATALSPAPKSPRPERRSFVSVPPTRATDEAQFEEHA